jgi:hypothetical protein
VTTLEHLTNLKLVPVWAASFDEKFNQPDLLRQLVAKHLHPGDVATAFDGGFTLISNDEAIITPQCCCDLSTFSDWRDAAAYRRAEWTMLWIGHPWISIRFGDPWLVLSEPQESGVPVDRWTVDPEELRSAVAAAEAELIELADRLRPVAESLGAKDPGKVGRRMAGLTG